jgi:tripartite-type tricarboxylate transporter receptor subunit TctC
MQAFFSRRAALGAVAGLLAPAGAALAQGAEWLPTKPVRIVVPIVGSTNDALARLIAPELQKALGQPFFVDNKGGAGGLIGTNDVVHSAPDGHTLLVGFNGPLAINVTLFPKMPYDPVKDLAPITLAVSTPQFLVVNAKVPARNMPEFLALAKKGSLSYGSVSVGSASHLTMEMLKAEAHVNITHVPYKGAAPAVTDLVAGQVDAAFLVPGNIQQFVQEGKARLLATTGEKRFASTPEVPTMIESGFPGFVALSWIGILAPAGTPRPVIDRYHRELVRIFNLPEIKSKLEKMEFEVVASSPQQFGDWIKAEIPRWGKVIKDNNIKAE